MRLAITSRRMRLASVLLAAVATACSDDPIAPKPGALVLTIVGLPDGKPAGVTISGPADFSRTVDATTTLSDLKPGPYTLTAHSIATSEGVWSPAVATQTITVRSTTAPTTAVVSYDLSTSRLMILVTGLPGATPAAIALAGPDGFARTVTGPQSIDFLKPGTYTVTAADVTVGGAIYRATQPSQSATLSPSVNATTVAVNYVVLQGALTVTINGLPSGAPASVTVTGPSGFTRDLTASTTLGTLTPGTYTITARTASSSGGTVLHSPSPASQTVTVSSTGTAAATITYTVFELDLLPVVSGLAAPIFLTAPAGDARLFIVERAGRIRIMRAGQLLPTPFLDIASRVSTDGERGLLSMAFDPAYATNGFFYLYFTNLAGEITVERYSASPGSDIANPAATPVIRIPHAQANNHNGGLVMFGPDGMLYLATGDGGGGGDPFANGQNTATLLGKMLRIDVRTLPYVIPASNPYAGQSGKAGEIWAIGLRNPWRFDFDTPPGSALSELYIADVGQGTWEEIDVSAAAVAGINYGWNIMEGAHCFAPATGCNEAGLTRPVFEYDHSQGCSITGGFVYRGSALPELAGQYFYSDYCQGWLGSMAGDRSHGFTTRRWSVPAAGNVVSFGEDASGEVYVISQNGTVYRIVRK